MSSILTVREQNRLVVALDNLRTSDRVHKSDLKTANKILDKMHSVANSKELLSSLSPQMYTIVDIKNSKNVESFIDNVKGKLEKQNSKIHEKKLTLLNNIGERMLQDSQNLSSKKIKSLTKEAQVHITNAERNESRVLKSIESENELKKLLATEIETLNNITPQQIRINQDERIHNSIIKMNDRIDEYNPEIFSNNEGRKELIKFLRKQGKGNVINDLEKAKRDINLKKKMSTDNYAEKIFGTKIIEVEGRRSYSRSEKMEVLSNNGRKYLKHIYEYNKAEKNLNSINNIISDIKSSTKKEINEINSEKRSPLQSIHDTRIAQYKKDIEKVEDTKNYELNALANNINNIDNTIKQIIEFKKNIEEKADVMADSEIQKSAPRGDKSIGKLITDKERLVLSYQQIVDALRYQQPVNAEEITHL